MNRGASKPPAVTGSITVDSSGMPTMAKPPPKAPFMKQIRKTPTKATRMVAAVSSMLSPPYQVYTGERLYIRPRGSRRPSSPPRPVGKGGAKAADRLFDLALREADVPQLGVIGLAKPR